MTAAMLTVAACATADRQASAPAGAWAEPVAPELAVQTFDSAWSRIATTYYDSTFRGLDWDGVRSELRPRAQAAGTVGELRRVIQSMLDRVGESHFVLIAGEVAAGLITAEGKAVRGDAGIELRWLDEAVVVTRVASESSAEEAGVRSGWILEAVADRRLEELMEAAEENPDVRLPSLNIHIPAAAQGLLGGEPGTTVRAGFLDGAGEPVAVELERRTPSGEPVRLGHLPTIFAHAEHERLMLDGGRCAGLIRFNIWLVAVTAPFMSALDAYSECDGLVIDLRGNMGGLLGMISGFTGAFLDEPVRLGTMRTRGNDLRLVANPRRATADGRPVRPYQGAVAILVDDWTVSAAELFTAGLQWAGRARVFGVPTAGEALPSYFTRLPNGDVMTHVIADFELPDGRRVEGKGVSPDEHVLTTRTDLLAGRDRPLEAALDWIRATGPTSAAHR